MPELPNWSAVLTGLQAHADAAGLITWDVNVDSTICRAHQHAAGARRDSRAQQEPPGGKWSEPDDHGLGRSRGGWTTKIHLACEQGQRPLSLLITAGCGATRRIRRARTVHTYVGAGSSARSRNLPIRPATASAGNGWRAAPGLRPRGLQGPARG